MWQKQGASVQMNKCRESTKSVYVRVKTPLADIVEILVDCAVPSREWRNLSAGREPLLCQPKQTSTSCRPSNRLLPILQQMPVILPIVTLQKYKFSWFCHRLTAREMLLRDMYTRQWSRVHVQNRTWTGFSVVLGQGSDTLVLRKTAKPVQLANVNRIANQQIQTESFNASSNHFPYQQCSHNWKLLNQSSPVTLKLSFTSLTQNS